MSHKKLSPFVRRRLNAKIKRVAADNPSLSHKQVLGKAVGILQGEEAKQRKSHGR